MNLLNKDLLVRSGSFTAAAPVQHEIKWYVTDDQGKEQELSAIVYIRKKSFATVNTEAKFQANDGVMVARICASIVNEQGQPLFSPEDLMGNSGRELTEDEVEHGPICESLGMALLAAIWEVNGLSKKPDPKPLRKKKNSGANSSSPESAAKQ
jgi:hypothetical protein